MKPLKLSLLILGLIALIYLFVPSTMLAQDDPIPPCCGNVVIIPIENGIIIIMEPDTEAPPEEDPAAEPIAQSRPVEAFPAILPEMAAERSRSAAVIRELAWSV